ncbi:hypothetical protein Tco_0328339 [Tanacetum coccineum]
MESSSSNSEEIELQQMQLNERELHQKCLAWFTKLKIHLETLHISFHYMKTRSFEIPFCLLFLEEYESGNIRSLLVKEGIALNDNTGVTENSGTESKNSSTETTFSRSEKESSSSEGNAADADIGPSYDK